MRNSPARTSTVRRVAVQYEFSAVGQFESQSNRFVNTGRQGFTNGLPIAAQTTTKANWAGRTPHGRLANLPRYLISNCITTDSPIGDMAAANGHESDARIRFLVASSQQIKV